MANSGVKIEYDEHFDVMRNLELFTREQMDTIRMVRVSFNEEKKKESERENAFRLAIRYEILLLDATRERSKALFKSSEKEYKDLAKAMVKQIVKLFDLALFQYRSKIEWWYEYFRFLARNRVWDILSDRIVQLTTEPTPMVLEAEDFLKCIDFEFHFGRKQDRIDQLIARAKSAYPRNVQIHCASLRGNLNKRMQDKDNLESLERVKATLSDGLHQFNGSIDFYYEFLIAIDQYAFTKPMQEQIAVIVRTVFQNRYTQTPYFFYKMALREYYYPYVLCICKRAKMKNEKDKEKDKQEKAKEGEKNEGINTKNKADQCPDCRDTRLKDCITKFGKILAVAKTRPEDEAELVQCYIELLLEINKDRSYMAAERLQSLRDAFVDTFIHKHVTEDHYARFIYLLNEIDPTDVQILHLHQEATTRFATTERPWIDYMKYYIRQNELKPVSNIYKAGSVALTANCATFHYTYMYFLLVLPDEDRMDLFKSAIIGIAMKTSPEFCELKAQILRLLHEKIGVEYTHIVYEKIIRYHKACLPVYNTMLEIQRGEINREALKERNILKKMQVNFGETNADVWIKTVEFVREMGNHIDGTRRFALATLKSVGQRAIFERECQKYMEVIDCDDD